MCLSWKAALDRGGKEAQLTGDVKGQVGREGPRSGSKLRQEWIFAPVYLRFPSGLEKKGRASPSAAPKRERNLLNAFIAIRD